MHQTRRLHARGFMCFSHSTDDRVPPRKPVESGEEDHETLARRSRRSLIPRRGGIFIDWRNGGRRLAVPRIKERWGGGS